MMIKTSMIIVMVGCVMMAMFAVDCWGPTGFFVSEAEAVVGRPATPGSVAGVARRTTRRTVHRTAHRY